MSGNDCNQKCAYCGKTDLVNLSDGKDVAIGYSYAYKVDCVGDRYIKAEEVKYLLDKCRADAIGMFLNAIKTYDTYGYEVDELGEGNYLVKLDSDNEKDFVPYIHLDDVIKCAEGVLKEQKDK